MKIRLNRVYFTQQIKDFIEGAEQFDNIKYKDRVIAFSGQAPIEIHDGDKEFDVHGYVTEIFVIGGMALLVPRDSKGVPCHSVYEFRINDDCVIAQDSWGETMELSVISQHQASTVLPRWAWYPWKQVKSQYLPDPDEDYDYWSELWQGYGVGIVTYGRKLDYRHFFHLDSTATQTKDCPRTNLYSVVVRRD
jgi:hypothetical protein